MSASWLSVRTGPILTYCYEPKAAAAQLTAWTNAVVEARRVLPSYPAFSAGVASLQLVAQLNAHGDDAWSVTGYGAAGARDGVAVLYVRVGVLTIGCYDQPTVAVLRDIWARAATLGQVLWRESERCLTIRTPGRGRPEPHRAAAVLCTLRRGLSTDPPRRSRRSPRA